MRVTLKLATSLDGRIATAAGESRWITGEAAREAAHRLRAAHAAVLVGVETVLADDPELTVRLAGYAGPQPTRVVLDSRQRTPTSAKLVAGARETPTRRDRRHARATATGGRGGQGDRGRGRGRPGRRAGGGAGARRAGT